MNRAPEGLAGELAAAPLANAAATPVSTNVLLVIERPIISGFYESGMVTGTATARICS
jgi:hypothetical protein